VITQRNLITKNLSTGFYNVKHGPCTNGIIMTLQA